MTSAGDIVVLERRSTGAKAAAIIGCMLAGPLLGIALARLVAPDSKLADFIGFVGLALIFFGGYKLWFLRIAFALWPYLSDQKSLAVLYDVLMRRRSSERRSMLSSEDAQVLAKKAVKAASSFAIVSVCIGIAVGLAFAFVSKSFASAFLLYSATSVAYGYALTRLARSGYLLTSEY